MRILMMAINDPAGTAIALAKAVNRYTEHTCRLITKELRYNFRFDKDLHLPWLIPEEWDEVEHLLRTSDIFHFHMTADEDLELGAFRPRDFLQGKLIVHHHHGHPDFRGNPEKYRRKYQERGRKKLLVSTPDLLHLLPEARWQPNLVPLHDPRYLPLLAPKHLPLKIAHSPTRQDLKNTVEIMATVGKMKNHGLEVELELIENTQHSECLRRKRRCHLLFDHLQGYFGVSSLEGLSQGLCVLAGLDDWNQRCVLEFTGAKELPWVITDQEHLEGDIKTLLGDGHRRQAISRRSRLFMERCWHEPLLVRRLMDFYQL